MIFVTVGTHEQGFDRLIAEMDRLKENGSITEEVMMQTGYTTYQPQHCQWSAFLTYDQMNDYMQQADIIITHGGPATFMGVIAQGKTPIVVPRKKQYDEHINDHQLEFVQRIATQYQLLVVENIQDLATAIQTVREDAGANNNVSNRDHFVAQLEKIIGELV